MRGTEIDRLVETSASDCGTCQRHHTQIGQRHHDLRDIVRKALRNPDRYKADVAPAKAAVEEVRSEALRHIEGEH